MRMDFLCGLDLAKKRDYTAFVILRRTPLSPELHQPVEVPDAFAQEEVPVSEEDPLLLRAVYSKQVPRGTSYERIADHACALADHPKLKGLIQFAVDATGVGEAVLEILEGRPELESLIWAITTTPGQRATRKKGMNWSVPKKDLKDAVLVKLQQKRLVCNPLDPEDMELLRQQLFTFKPKYTEKQAQVWEAEGSSEHDDMAIALALATWLSDQVPLEDQGEWGGQEPYVISQGAPLVSPRGYPSWRGTGGPETHRPSGVGPITTPETYPLAPPRRR